MNTYKIKSSIWLYPVSSNGGGSWHFTSIPKKQAEEIKKRFGAKHRGWSSLPVSVTIGKTNWKTSIFYDKRSITYLLPLKAQIRKKEGLMKGDSISYLLRIVV